MEAQLRLALKANELEKARDLVKDAIEAEILPEIDIRRLASDVWGSGGQIRSAIDWMLPSLKDANDTDNVPSRNANCLDHAQRFSAGR